MRLVERGAKLGFRIRVLGAPGHGDPKTLGKQLQGFIKADALEFGYELQHVAARAASKAFVKLVRGVHGKRGRLLGMERTQPHVASGSGFAQTDVLLDDLDDVD